MAKREIDRQRAIQKAREQKHLASRNYADSKSEANRILKAKQSLDVLRKFNIYKQGEGKGKYFIGSESEWLNL